MLGYVVLSGPDVPAVGTVDQPRLISVAMDDTLRFMPMDIPVTQGETVTFVLPNLGQAVHEFQVGPAGLVAADTVDGSIVVEVDEIENGHVKTVTYTFDGPGPYAYACHEPGHYESGHEGNDHPPRLTRRPSERRCPAAVRRASPCPRRTADVWGLTGDCGAHSTRWVWSGRPLWPDLRPPAMVAYWLSTAPPRTRHRTPAGTCPSPKERPCPTQGSSTRWSRSSWPASP